MISLDKYRQAETHTHKWGVYPEPQCYIWSCSGCGTSARYYTLDECLDGAQEHCRLCRKWWSTP